MLGIAMHDHTLQSRDEVFIDDDVDYTRESYRRYFKLKFDDETLYVDPTVLAQASPVFEAMLLDWRFRECMQNSVIMTDENIDDFIVLLRTICPTYYALYPYPINEFSFPILARLADKFLINGLKNICEQFAFQPDLNKCTLQSLIHMLDSTHQYSFSSDVQQHLLFVILHKPFKRLNSNDETCNLPTYKMIVHNFGKHNFFKHNVTMDKSGAPGLYCTLCFNSVPFFSNLGFCSECKCELCSNCCHRLCSALVQQSLDSIDDFL